MPAVGIYLALVKGWLGRELDKLYPVLESHLLSHPHINYTTPELKRKRLKLAQLGQYFKNHPVPVAIVTSSIEYEAQIVLRRVFSVIKEQVADWPVSSQLKRRLLSQFANYDNVYNALITASDSSEMRLKPHRDLFSLALYRLGLKPSEFDSVIGFEDSESGLLAIRSAGIGKSVAVPFSATKGHDLSSASTYLYGGLPEAILFYNNFLKLQ
ncbi:MAG: hypothetical protein HY973_04610 [Candidatus Kerfeldbacteria bacterium]|nr:hypothetical protein [Candidatus Kerfeldbacteria bacterium]